MDKSELRCRAKDIRKTLDIEEISRKICEKIRHFEDYEHAQNVMIFYPIKYEINLLELLEDKKNFYLPKVYNSGKLKNESGKEILVCPYSSDLKKSELNIYEPCTEPINPEVLDLIFVPALIVDKNNYRLGYGGGFYDRFLMKYPDIKTIVPIPKELITEKLPHSEFDVKVDEIIFQ
ncbi:5-formyltetrahydrofolate cyclo-ligase [bacterium]|nr:5-formyltetrahydrofolate cyclo-ligase [bacterium]